MNYVKSNIFAFSIILIVAILSLVPISIAKEETSEGLIVDRVITITIYTDGFLPTETYYFKNPSDEIFNVTRGIIYYVPYYVTDATFEDSNGNILKPILSYMNDNKTTEVFFENVNIVIPQLQTYITKVTYNKTEIIRYKPITDFFGEREFKDSEFVVSDIRSFKFILKIQKLPIFLGLIKVDYIDSNPPYDSHDSSNDKFEIYTWDFTPVVTKTNIDMISISFKYQYYVDTIVLLGIIISFIIFIFGGTYAIRKKIFERSKVLRKLKSKLKMK